MKIIVVSNPIMDTYVDVVDVSEDFLYEKLPSFLVKEGVYDSLAEVPKDDGSLVHDFLEHWCQYDLAYAQWNVTDNEPQINHLTPEDYL